MRRYLGGYIAAAFFAVGAPAALCIGYLCDKMNRRNLLFAVVILGEQPTCPSLSVPACCCTCFMPDST